MPVRAAKTAVTQPPAGLAPAPRSPVSQREYRGVISPWADSGQALCSAVAPPPMEPPPMEPPPMEPPPVVPRPVSGSRSALRPWNVPVPELR